MIGFLIFMLSLCSIVQWYLVLDFLYRGGYRNGTKLMFFWHLTPVLPFLVWCMLELFKIFKILFNSFINIGNENIEK